MATEDRAAQLLEQWQPLIGTIARDQARGDAEAEDLAQEISLTIWQKLRSRPDAPREYLSMVAKYTAIKYRVRGVSIHRRFTQAKVGRVWEQVRPDGDPKLWDLLDMALRRRDGGPSSPVEDLVVALDLYDRLRGVLAPQQGAFLDLRLQGYSPAEAGAALGLGRDQVRRVAQGVRRGMRHLLDGQDVVEDAGGQGGLEDAA